MKNNLLSEDQIFSDLKLVVGKLMRLDPKEVDERLKNHDRDSRLRDDLGIDSVESLDFLHAIEDFYSITIRDEEIALLEKISDVIDLIKKKKKL